MPVSWRALANGSQAVATANTTSVAATLPADLKGGDTCYAYIQFNPGTGSPTVTPAGWTLLGGTDIVFSASNHAQVWKHTAAGATGAASSEAGGTITFGGYGTQRVGLAVAAGRTDGTENFATRANGTDTTPFTTPPLAATRPNGADRLVFVGQRSSTPSTAITNSSGLTQAMACGAGSGAVSVAVGVDNPGVVSGDTMGATTWAQAPSALTGWIEVTIAAGIPGNAAPTANAGPDQSVTTSSTVTLDGSGSSDLDGDTFTYAWTRISGPAVTLSSATAQKPTFTAPGSSGTLVFSLVVTDSHGAASSADTVSITVNDPATRSVTWRALVAGQQTVATGNTTTASVTLPADLKGGDTCYLAFNFNPTTGTPTAGLTGWTQVGADIVLSASHHAQLWKKTAAGTTGSGSSDAGTTVMIGGYGTQRVAMAVACGRTTGTEDIATLANGTDTTPFNAPAVAVTSNLKAENLTFIFQRSSTPSTSITNSSGLASVFSVGTGSGACSVAVGEGSATTNNGSNQSATTWAQSPAAQTGWIQMSLAVGAPVNAAPTANAGPDQSVVTSSTVTLDGSSSADPESDSITYAWTRVSGPVVSLSSTTAQKPTFTAPSSPGTIVLSLVVTDSNGSTSTADTVTITVNSQAPTANAGPDQTAVEPFSTVTLDGSGSSDPDGGALTYAWTQTAGTTTPLSSSTAQKPTLTAPADPNGTTLTYRLVVTDADGISSSADTVNIAVLNHTCFRLDTAGPTGIDIRRL